MRLIFTAILFIVTTIINAAPADDFVITVKTNNPGSDTNLQYTIFKSFVSEVGLYNYNVDCDNDGIDEVTGQTGNYVCSYPTAGIYTIRIKDNTGTRDGFPSFKLGAGGNSVAEKILSVEQWGTGKWQYLGASFAGAENLVINATDQPDFSNVKNMSLMFLGAILANPDTSNWDTSFVTTMSGMFSGAILANPDTSNWNTSSVTDMSSMFFGAISANPDTSNWNTSSVTNMLNMFSGAVLASPNTSNWNTQAVTDMRFMFRDVTLANPDTSNWDLSNVTTMAGIFLGVTLPTLSYEDMLIGFASQNLQNNVPFHGGNSRYCSAAAQAARASLIDNYNWTITDSGPCDPADDFVIRIKSDEPGGTPTKFTIITAGSGYDYNVDCDNDGVFEVYAQISDYTCNYALSGAGIYTLRIQDNSGIGTGYTKARFNSSTVRQKILSIEQWGSAQWSNMNQAFKDCNVLVINATDTPNFSNVSDFRLMFSGASMVNPDTSNWDLSSATDIAGMFRNANLATPDTTNWNTSKVTDTSFMFNGALAANPDVSNWDTAMVTNMSNMFAGATSASPIISAWDVSSVTDMSFMFSGLTLPTIEYDNILVNFSVQNLKSNVNFDAGNSRYCSAAAQTARASIISFNGWNITDGGQCNGVDDIFLDGFEAAVVVFKSVDAQFAFDFSDVDFLPEDETPKLIAKGLDMNNYVNVRIYLRQFDSVLEIMQSQLLENIDGEQLWSDGLWYEVFEQGLSEVVLW